MGLKEVDESDCDVLTRRRVREAGVVVGAIWHIYHPRDADKIRDMLNKVCTATTVEDYYRFVVLEGFRTT